MKRLSENRLKKCGPFFNLQNNKTNFSPLTDIPTDKTTGYHPTHYKEIDSIEERSALVLGIAGIGYCDIDLESNQMHLNAAFKNLIGTDTNDPRRLLQISYKRIAPLYRDEFKRDIERFLNGHLLYLEREYPLTSSTGSVIWVNHRAKIMERSKDGKPVQFLVVCTDITRRKRYEEEILYLHCYDALTGLKSRSYLEQKFKEVDQLRMKNYALVMGDMNGLKLVNDTFGQQEGDKTLRIVSNVLRSNAAADDMVTRWSGDEFIILCINKPHGYADGLIQRIQESNAQLQEFLVKNGYRFFNNTEETAHASKVKLKISLALGSAETAGKYVRVEELLRLAEERMCRQKLLEGRSVRSDIITSLESSLLEKDSETEAHTIRLRKISRLIGVHIGLTQDELDALELLGLIHDIGKIGIPDQILNKPGKLTKAEWEVMKTHTEIGYRIASSIPELSHIAYSVLCHHERYDGTGYPHGIKGDKIPLLSRIINVVDAFDVMTHSRPYKQAFALGTAIHELKAQAGNQFDPKLAGVFIELVENGEIAAE